MTVKSIIRMGHPTLKKVAERITRDEFETPQLKNLIEDLYDTMKFEKGIGIAVL